MPNWKSYESSVRLLSAIIAAHPTLKLNYDDIVRFYGSHCTKSALKNHFDRDLSPNIKILKGMLDHGLDPKDAVLIEGVRPGNPGKSQAFVISSTFHIFFHVPFSSLGIDVLSEVARCYGKSVNGKAIRNFFDRTVKHDVKAVLDTLEAGGDPEELQLSGIVKIGGGGGSGTKAIAGQYGDGVTDNGGGSAKKTPVKRTPKKKAAAIKGEDGDDDESMPSTPSKSALNKVKGSRVTKTITTPRRGAASKVINYQELEDDEETGLQGTPKVEMSDDDISSPHYGNGNGAVQSIHNGNGYASNGHSGNGYSNGYTNDNDGFEDDDVAGHEVYFEAVDDEI